MAKQVIYGDEARQKLKAGVDAIARAVITTLGPKGRNVSIERPWTHPLVVHDGVTVARAIELKDPFENQGAQMVKEASAKTNDIAGDGTTTSMVIAQAVVEEGLRNVTAGANPMVMKDGLEKAVQLVNEDLLAMAKPVKNKAAIANVARISAANEEIGNLVAQALEKVGRNGTVTVEEGNELTTDIKFKEGMEIKGGLMSPYFITNPERREGVMREVAVFVTDRIISSGQEMLSLLNNCIANLNTKELVIIAPNIENHALATLVTNHMNSNIGFQGMAIKAPRGGDRTREILEDIASLTGGTVVSEDRGIDFDKITKEDLGFATKVTSDQQNTVIVADKTDAVQTRIASLQESIKKEKDPIVKERYQDRLAKLEGGLAVINVGGSTDVEIKERVERVKDAIGATKAAIEEGIVPGGGVALVRVADKLGKHISNLQGGFDKEYILGMEILQAALLKPLWYIADNAGVKADHVVEKVRGAVLKNDGYNVYTDTYEDVVKAGVIDPVMVTRHAVMHGASVAAMVLTTTCLICDDPDEKKEGQDD